MLHWGVFSPYLVIELFKTTLTLGIQTEVTKQLMAEAKIDTLQDSQKYVAVVFDEVKIKEGIVYDKNEWISCQCVKSLIFVSVSAQIFLLAQFSVLAGS